MIEIRTGGEQRGAALSPIRRPAKRIKCRHHSVANGGDLSLAMHHDRQNPLAAKICKSSRFHVLLPF